MELKERCKIATIEFICKMNVFNNKKVLGMGHMFESLSLLPPLPSKTLVMEYDIKSTFLFLSMEHTSNLKCVISEIMVTMKSKITSIDSLVA